MPFSDCHSLTTIKIPLGIQVIDNNTFENCYSLKNVEIPNSVKNINKAAFEFCSNIRHLTLPDSVETIGDKAFSRCGGLKTIKLSNNLSDIGKGCFYDCSNLKFIDIPEKVALMPEYAFLNCSSLKHITIPNVIGIEKGAFKECKSLENIEINDKAYFIGEEAFKSCLSLKSIKLPSNLEFIEKSSFQNCLSLTDVSIQDYVKYVGECAFENCRSLKNINLPNSITTISRYAFSNCSSLENIKLPDYIPYIDVKTFENCTSLKEITIPPNVNHISKLAFYNCTSLETVNISEGLNSFSEKAFFNCKNLKSITIPKSLEYIGADTFKNCESLKTLNLPLSVIRAINIGDFKFTMGNDSFDLSLEPKENSIPLENLKIDPAILAKGWKNKSTLLKEQNNPKICDFYNEFLLELPKEKINNFIESHNFTFFKQFNIPEDFDDRYELYKGLYNLGVFSKPIEVNGKMVDYAQKVTGALISKLNDKTLCIARLSQILEDMELKEFNREFTDFLLENLDELIKEDNYQIGFIARCYNEFEEVQKTNTSNRGSQRQLKPTIEKFVDYFKENKFYGVTEETAEIATTISPYFSNQATFDRAVSIAKEKERNKVKNNILSTPLKEENPFENIDSLSKDIKKEQIQTLSNLSQVADNSFTYEWLEKNDPKNYILGKLCECCAHLEGAGYGIMRASIVHPNIQTLVIKDKNNRIAAKSTLYLNPKQVYGVFNNVEVNLSAYGSDRDQIYEKYILGVKAFVDEYNKENPNTPIKKINVGMNLNDLSYEIEEYNKKATELLSAIDYSKYCPENYGHAGDSESSQYTIWEKE